MKKQSKIGNVNYIIYIYILNILTVYIHLLIHSTIVFMSRRILYCCLRPTHYALAINKKMSFHSDYSFNYHSNYHSMHYCLVYFFIYNSNFHLLREELAIYYLHSIEFFIFVHSIIAAF